MKTTQQVLSRRQLLLRTWQATLAMQLAPFLSLSGCGWGGQTSTDIEPGQLITREAYPQNLETPLVHLTTWITPNELFFIRTHNDTPRLDQSDWRLRIDGAVSHPLTLSLNELKAFPSVSEVVTLECSGNGRVFL